MKWIPSVLVLLSTVACGTPADPTPSPMAKDYFAATERCCDCLAVADWPIGETCQPDVDKCLTALQLTKENPASDRCGLGRCAGVCSGVWHK